jgi:hypothetical protein
MTTVYGASPVKRGRRTQAEMLAFREAIFDIVAEHRPCSVRHVYYQAATAGLVPKDVSVPGKGRTRASEKKVGDALNIMREETLRYNLRDHNLYDPDDGLVQSLRELLILPFQWITDNTRTRFQADLHESKDAALRDMARFYRRDLWRSQANHVEVWCESDSIAGVLGEVTDDYGVALLPCRGQAPKRFVWDSAQSYARIGKPVTCLYVGDFDPSGLDIGASVEERLDRYTPAGSEVDVEFIRLAIEPDQVDNLGLLGHGVNPNITPAQRERFFDVCDTYSIPREAVEAEAMDPTTLREIVGNAIMSCIDPRQWELEMAVEKEERKALFDLAGGDSA